MFSEFWVIRTLLAVNDARLDPGETKWVMGSLLQVIFFQETFVPSLSVAYKTSDYFFISYQESCYNYKQFINGKQASINKKEGNLRTSNAKIEKEFNDPFKVYLLCHDLQTLNRNKANDAKLHAKIVWNQFHI